MRDAAASVRRITAAGVEALRQGLTSEHPDVRATAARLAATNATAALLPAVRAAWEREQNDMVAAEQVRTMIAVLGATLMPVIDARLPQAGPEQALAMAEALAREHAPLLTERLPQVAARLEGDRSELNDVVRLAFRSDETTRERLWRSWMGTTTPEVWLTFIDDFALEEAGVASMFVGALTSDNAAVREVTVWNLLKRLATTGDAPPAILDAALPRENTPDEGPNWERFGREVVARHHRGATTPDRASFIAAEPGLVPADALLAAALGSVQDAERRALAARIEQDASRRSPTRSSGFHAPSSKSTAMRSFPLLWPGLLAAVVRGADCRPSRGTDYVVVQAFYRRNGRPQRAHVDEAFISPKCMRMVRALVGLLIADRSKSTHAAYSELLILPIDQESVRCASDSAAAMGSAVALGRSAQIRPPQKVRDVRPAYPPSMLEAGVQGVVTVEVVIASTGCVPRITVLQSAQPPLDYAAVRAVSKWRFEPTRVNGTPFPVIMTVTVAFRIE